MSFSDGQTYTPNGGNISFVVKSTKPTLTIASFSPDGEHQSPKVTGSNWNPTITNPTVNSRREGNTLILYLNATGSKGWFGASISLKGEPKVTLKFTNLGKAENATLIFSEANGGTVHLYEGTSSRAGTRTNQFYWDSSTGEEVLRIVGYIDSGDCSSTTHAGTLNSENKVVLTYKNGNTTETYNVPTDVITIINQQPD